MIDYNIPINITEDKWTQMLVDKNIFSKRMLLIYVMGGKATAKELSLIEGTNPTSYNSSVVSLSKRIINNVGVEPPKRDNGNDVFWSVPFIVQELQNNTFQCILRNELFKALDNMVNNR